MTNGWKCFPDNVKMNYKDKPEGEERSMLEGFDFSNFWEDSEYALKEYVSEPPTDEMIDSVERELGYKLPASYIWLMKQHRVEHYGGYTYEFYQQPL